MNRRRERTSSGESFFHDASGVDVKHLSDLLDIAQRGGDRQIIGSPLCHEQPGDSRAAIWSTSASDREIDGLHIAPLAAGEAACGPLKRVRIGATFEQQRHPFGRAAADGPMERRSSGSVAEVDEVGIRIEEPSNFDHVTPCRSRVDGMISGLRADAAATIPCVFEEPGDLGVALFARHLDQAHGTPAGLSV